MLSLAQKIPTLWTIQKDEGLFLSGATSHLDQHDDDEFYSS